MLQFPKLKIKEIQHSMQELQCPIQEKDLNEPKPEVVMKVYEYFLELLVGSSREVLSIPSSQGIDMIQYKELHMESIGEASLLRELIKLMFAVGVPDFSAKDLLVPEKERFKTTLSALINFAKFRQEHMDGYLEFCDQSEQLLEVRAREESRHRSLHDQVVAVREERSREQPYVHTIEEEILVLNADVSALNKEQLSLRKEVDKKKAITQELKDNCTAVKYAVATRKKEALGIKAQIVQSPEKMKKAIDDLGRVVEQETKNIQRTNEKLAEVHTKMASIKAIDEDIKRIGETLEACLVEYKKLMAMKKAIKDSESKIEENQQLITEIEQHLQHVTRLIAAKNEQIQAQKQKRAAKIQSAQEALDALKHSKNNAENDCMQENLRRSELQTRISQIEDEIDDATRGHQHQIEALNAKLVDVQAEFMGYKRRVIASINSLAQQTVVTHQEAK